MESVTLIHEGLVRLSNAQHIQISISYSFKRDITEFTEFPTYDDYYIIEVLADLLGIDENRIFVDEVDFAADYSYFVVHASLYDLLGWQYLISGEIE
jgi:hypothetical protein